MTTKFQKTKDEYYCNNRMCGVGHHESEYIADSTKANNYIKQLEKINSELVDVLSELVDIIETDQIDSLKILKNIKKSL